MKKLYLAIITVFALSLIACPTPQAGKKSVKGSTSEKGSATSSSDSSATGGTGSAGGSAGTGGETGGTGSAGGTGSIPAEELIAPPDTKPSTPLAPGDPIRKVLHPTAPGLPKNLKVLIEVPKNSSKTKAECVATFKKYLTPQTRILVGVAQINREDARFYSDNELQKETEPLFTMEHGALVTIETLANGDVKIRTPLSFYVRRQPVTAEAEWIIKKADLKKNSEGKYEVYYYKGVSFGARGKSYAEDKDIYLEGTWDDSSCHFIWSYNALGSQVVCHLKQVESYQ